ncbi:MAG: protoporphyrinogen oxidase [Deltaproteobacteria bacterium]|nr:protoporphyrinogen oxidase [Deltaproteobacteria bacterium]
MAVDLNKKRVIIIGGGISGLSAAFWLKQKGFHAVVLERNARAGGLIKSERVGGALIDHAANCVFNFLPEVNFMVNTLGLGPEKIARQEAAKRRYLVKNGKPKVVPMKIGELIFSDLWSLKAKLRLMVEPLIPKSAPEQEETVAQFITRRLGREVFDRSIEPYVTGTLAGDAEKACLKSTFKQFAALEQDHGSILKGVVARKMKGIRTACAAEVFSFKDGMESLIKGLGNYLGDKLVTDCPIEKIERVGKEWYVHTGSAGNSIIKGDAVVMATPAGIAAGLVDQLSVNLSMMLKGIEYSSMNIIYITFKREDVEHKLDGIGCLIPAREKGFSSLGSLWSSTLFPGRTKGDEVLFTSYLGGMRNKDLVDLPDEELIDRCLKDLRQLVGVKGFPSLTRVVRHKKALPQYNLGHQMFLKKLDEELALIPGLHVTGNYLQGVSVRACISQGKTVAETIGRQFDAEHVKFKKSQRESPVLHATERTLS